VEHATPNRPTTPKAAVGNRNQQLKTFANQTLSGWKKRKVTDGGDLWQLQWENCVPGEVIGTGKDCAAVRKLRVNVPGMNDRWYAVKMFSKKHMLDKEVEWVVHGKGLLSPVGVIPSSCTCGAKHAHAKHARACVCMIGIHEQHFGLVMPLADMGTLHDNRHHERFQTPKAQTTVISDITDGLQTLHDFGIVHMDLHSGNIVMLDKNNQNENNRELHAGIVDMGQAQMTNTRTRNGRPMSPTRRGWRLNKYSQCPPEKYDAFTNVTSKMDIYALGSLAQSYFPNVGKSDESWQNLLVKAASYDPSSRPSLKEFQVVLRKLRAKM